MIYILKIYRIDNRCKTGERLAGKYEFDRRDSEQMDREVNELHLHHYPRSKYRMTYYPKFKTVKNLMNGQDVVIETDTPYYLDPSYETYWSA